MRKLPNVNLHARLGQMFRAPHQLPAFLVSLVFACSLPAQNSLSTQAQPPAFSFQSTRIEPAPGFEINPPSWRLSRYGVAQGLTQGSNYCMLEDSRGFLWLSSFEGLNRFDGRRYVAYRNLHDDPRQPLGNNVTGIVEDGFGNLWVGTEKGLHRYLRRLDLLERLPAPGAENAGAFSATYPFFADSSTVWFINAGEGIVIYDFLKNERRIVTTELRYPYSESIVNSTLRAPDGFIWTRLDGEGLVRTHPATGALDYFFSKHPRNVFGSPQQIFTHFIDARGVLWLGIRGGLLELKTAAGICRLHDTGAFFQGYPEELSGEADGTIWIGTYDRGLFAWHPAKGMLRQFRNDGSPGALASNLCSSVLCGASGMVWASPDPEGLHKISPAFKHFRRYGATFFQEQDFTPAGVTDFAECSDGKLWVGLQEGGAFLFDPLAGRVLQRLKPDNGIHHIDAMLLDRSHRLWLATYQGLFLYDETTGKLANIPYLKSPGQGSFINDLVQAADGSVLLPTDGGLYFLPAGETVFRKSAVLGERLMGVCHVAKNGCVLAAEYFHGFFILQPGEWATAGGRQLPQFLPGENVKCFFEDEASGILWIGTTNGLFKTRLSPAADRLDVLKTYHVPDGLPSNTIYGILPEGMRNEGRGMKDGAASSLIPHPSSLLWLSTNRGVAEFDPASESFRHFTPADGLQGYEFNTRSFLKTASGEIYFGGTEGFNSFRPADIGVNPHPPASVQIIGLQVNDQPYREQGYCGELDKLSLNHDQNTLSIEFAAMDNLSEGDHLYRAMLESFDPDWVALGNRNFVRYARLPPGSYRLRVLAANSDGLWGEQERVLEIEVVAAWWQTIWFEIATLLAAVLLLFAALNFIFKTRLRLRLAAAEKAVEAERLRTRIAQDIHDEVGGSLTKISLAAQVAARLPDLSETELKTRLEKLGADARHAAGHLREIVFAINPDFDRFEEMQAYFQESAREFWSETACEPHFDFGKNKSNPSVPPDTKRQLLMLFKEAQNNAAKHADASKVWLVFKLTSPENYLLEVRDDGRGFDLAEKNGFTQGLSGMKKRAESIEATLTLWSEPGKGTSVMVRGQI